MRRNIKFGLSTGGFGTNLTVSGPSTALRLSTKHRDEARAAFESKVFRFEKAKPGTRTNQNVGELTLLATKLAGVVGIERKNVLKSVLDYLYFIGSGQADHLEADPDIIIHRAMATPGSDTPAITMKAPDMSDPKALEKVAVRAMAGMAENLRYTRLPLAETLSIFADEQRGLAIGAGVHPWDGLTTIDDYSPESGIVHLHSEGPGRPAQQLTALVGAVSIVAQANAVA